MTSTSATGSVGSAMTDLSPSPSATPGGIPTQSDAFTNVIPTSSKDVAATLSQFEYQSSESQLPLSIGPSSQVEDGVPDISAVPSSGFTSLPLSADVTSSVQSIQPSWILSSPTDSGTKYSTNSISLLSSTPTLPQSISVSRTDILSSYDSAEITSDLLSPTVNVLLSSNKVIATTSETLLVPKVSKTMDTSASKQGITSKPSSGSFTAISPTVSASSVITSSSIFPGILPRETTPYSGGKTDSPLEPRPGIPNSTIVYIVVPVCLLLFVVLIIVLIACLRRRKNTKEPTTNQNPDLWVNTQPEISLVPTTPTVIENPTETVPGFKAGDIVCQVVYPFTAQLDGQMSLTEKDLIKVLEKADNGWWRGASQSGEQSGWFPGCYVEEFKAGSETNTLEGSQSKGKSRVSSFMLKKRERIRRKSAAAVSPLSLDTTLGMSTSTTMPALNSAEISKFSDGKVFRALFAYQGSSKGELSIEEGDIVRGWEKDRNGWMHGRKVITGEEGWFPAVYVDEVPSDTGSISGESTLSGPIMYDQLAPNKHRQSGQEWLGIEHRAIHSYNGNSESDLSFEAGDIIIIFDTLDNGWWLGSRGDDVGWLPGSYLEITDSGREDESRSDVSSLLSSYDDRNRTVDEDLSHMTSSQSLSSNLSDSKPKPKPARKAPPPPKLKPLKIPAREDNQGSIKKSQLNQVILKSPDQEPQYAVIKKENTTKGSDSKPRRPAPPPPPKRGTKSQPTSPEQSSTVASSAASSISENKLKPGEKPVLPKRFAKPKVIRLPRQSSRLQNLAVNSRPSTRAAPPRPPPPKIPKTSKVRSSHSLSGIYSKSKESTFGKALSSSVKDLKENNNLQTDSVSFVDENNKPKRIPPVVVPMKTKPESTNENNSNEPQVRNAFANAKKSDTQVSDPEDSNKSEPSTSPMQSPRVLLYPLETGPTVSSPVIAPVKPPVIPPVKRPTVPPVRPAKGPRAEPPARPSIGPIHKSSVIPVPPPVVPRTSTVDISPEQSPDSKKTSNHTQSPKLEDTENPVEPKSPSRSTEKTEIPQPSSEAVIIKPDNVSQTIPTNEPKSPDDSLVEGQEVDHLNTSSESSSSEISQESVESFKDSPEPSPAPSPIASSKLPRTSPPKDVPKVISAPELPVLFSNSADEVPLESPPVVSSVPTPESPQISIPMNLQVQRPQSETQTPVSPSKSSPASPDVPSQHNESLESTNMNSLPNTSSSDNDHTSPSNESFDSTNTNSLPKVKPIPPPKPNRVPPPVLPKPKIKPKPSQLTVVLANPAPQNDPTPVRNVVNLQSPVRDDLKPVEEEHLDKEGSVEKDTPVETSEQVLDSVPQASKIEHDNHEDNNKSDTQGENDCVKENDFFDKGDNRDKKGGNPVEKGGNILGSISDSDGDEDFERNCDISSDSSATDNSSSIASDTLDLGSEIGESDDHTLDSSLDIITNQHFIDDPHPENNNESKVTESKPVLQQDNTDSKENSSNEPSAKLANGGPNEIANGLNKTSELENTNNIGHHNPNDQNGNEKDLTEKKDDDQNSSELPAEENGLPNGTKSDKPVPLPRSGLSPSKEGSLTRPARPPPPRSPGSATYRQVNQSEAGQQDKPKKKTLRQATKSYTPVGKGELAFEEGSFIKEMSKAIGRPGWCIGMLADGTTGLYPTSHVEEPGSKQSQV